MAIEIKEFRLPITPDEALRIIQRHTDTFGVFIDLDRTYELIGILSLNMREVSREAFSVAHKPFDLGKVGDCVDALIGVGADPKDFLNKKESTSFDKNTRAVVRQNPKNSAESIKLLDLIVDYRSLSYKVSQLWSYTTLPLCKCPSKDGHRMVLARPGWSLLSTSRIQSSTPNIQGLSKTIGDIITEPPGYTLIRCDSEQIEPRINFSTVYKDDVIQRLITIYNDAYFGILQYCLMTDDTIEKLRNNFDAYFVKEEISEEMKNKRSMLKTLTNAGSYGSQNLNGIDPILASRYVNRIVNHPSRKALERKVLADVEQGITTFYGAFGTPVQPKSNAKYEEGNGGWKNHLMRCGINNPTQTTASELMIHSVYNANKLLSQAKDSHIAYYKHDEGAFYVSDYDRDQGLLEELKDITAYNVEGWIPIPSDCLIGIKPPTYESYLC